MKKRKNILIFLISLALILGFLYNVLKEDEKPTCKERIAEKNQTCWMKEKRSFIEDIFTTFTSKAKCNKPKPTISPCQLMCPPTEEELKIARVAWKYFENNFNEKTGLFNAAHKYPSAAVWDWANALIATYAAYKFHIIDEKRFRHIMGKFLEGMQKLPFFNNELPNKTYNTLLAKMSDYTNKPLKEGNGWSAADLARLLSILNIIEQCEDDIAPQIEKLLVRIRYCRVLSKEGDMYGGTYKDGVLHIKHEALTGYEEYLARGYELWGFNAKEARMYKFVNEVEIYGIKIPTDTRPFFSNFVESEPFWYLGFEYGVDDEEAGRYIKNIYKVQEKRYEKTGILTAVTEDNIDRRPYFLFNTIYTHNEPWKTINQMGEDYDEYKTVSTKASFGMYYLFDTPYSQKIFNYIKYNYDPKKGYYAGIYEKIPGPNRAVTLNTNAIILEAMLSNKMGTLQKIYEKGNRGYFDYYRNHINNFRCLPTEKEFKILEPYDPLTQNNKKDDCNCSNKEKEYAKIAWKYIENNYNENTGLVNGVHKYPIIRPEHIGSQILATISARELDIIHPKTFDEMMKKLLNTLQTMKLYHNELPNLYYNAKTAKMVDVSGKVSYTGNGWDLYSIARMLTALYILQRDYPKYKNDVFKVVNRMNFKRAITKRFLLNRYFDGKKFGKFIKIEDPAQEYYIHNALKLFNIDTFSHFVDEKNLEYKAPYFHEIPFGVKNQLCNGEFYLWTMLEQPYYLKYKHYSSNIYLTLKDRYEVAKKLMTSSIEPIDKDPRLIYSNIYKKGKLWIVTDKKGKSYKNLEMISTKAAFIYDALYGYEDNFSKVLMEKIEKAYNLSLGWYGGVYVKGNRINRSLNLNTNAAVLESIYYKKIGNFYYFKDRKNYDRVRLYKIKNKVGYFIESSPFKLRYDAQKVAMKYNDLPYVRIERDEDGIDFVVKIGDFKTKEDAEKILQKLDPPLPEAKIKYGKIDIKNFIFATRYYDYNYHIPYKNEEFVGNNLEFEKYKKLAKKYEQKREKLKKKYKKVYQKKKAKKEIKKKETKVKKK